MVGYDYVVDITNQLVYRKKDMKPIKQSIDLCGKRWYLTLQDGKRKCISANRVIYSAMIGVSPDTIPKDVFVIYENGEFKLMYHKEMNARNHAKARANQIKRYRSYMAERIAEAQMLIDYYDTGDAKRVVEYVVGRHNKLEEYIYYHYHCSREIAHDVASEVIDDICQRALTHNLFVSSIGTTLQGMSRNVMRKRRMTTRYLKE